MAEANGGFYTQSEFDIAPLIAAHPDLRFLELGRSCVLKPYRTKPVVELLWQGIWNYVRAHDLDVMLGCASLEGTDPGSACDGPQLSGAQCGGTAGMAGQRAADRYVEMKLMPPETIDPKAALRRLPPLIKGYLRLGCYIGEGAVIDHAVQHHRCADRTCPSQQSTSATSRISARPND